MLCAKYFLLDDMVSEIPPSLSSSKTKQNATLSAPDNNT